MKHWEYDTPLSDDTRVYFGWFSDAQSEHDAEDFETYTPPAPTCASAQEPAQVPPTWPSGGDRTEATYPASVRSADPS